MIAYEIQTYNGGQWQIQAIFDDKELALLEARRLRAGRPSLAVRVVEEAYDDARRTSASRVVFRESPVDGHNAEVMERKSQTRREAEDWRSRKEAEKIRRPAAKAKGPSVAMLLTVFLLILVGGLAALMGLDYLSR